MLMLDNNYSNHKSWNELTLAWRKACIPRPIVAMPNVRANQSVGYITSVLHIAAIWQKFVFPKVAVCRVTLDWVTIESTSSYQVQKWIILQMPDKMPVKMPAKLAFKKRKAKTASHGRDKT